MFTGIVEETGRVKSLVWSGGSAVLAVEASVVLTGIREGDSIAVDGACLTVTGFGNRYFTADVSAETAEKTIIRNYRNGDRVNLERALQLSDRLGGHIVSGHIDGKGYILQVSRRDNTLEIGVGAGRDLSKYLITKGSVALNGVSLTVNRLTDQGFLITVIPHTLLKTSISGLKPGDEVNLECDMIAKYIERLMLTGDDRREKDHVNGVNMDFLREHGFAEGI